LGLNAGLADDFRPSRGFGSDPFAGLVGRAAHGLLALQPHFLDELARSQHAIHFAGKLCVAELARVGLLENGSWRLIAFFSSLEC